MRSRKMQPCCGTFVTAWFNERVSMSEPFSIDRNLYAVQEQGKGASYQHSDRQEAEKPLVSLYLYPKKGKVANDGSARSRHRENRPCPNEAWCQQQQRGN